MAVTISTDMTSRLFQTLAPTAGSTFCIPQCETSAPISTDMIPLEETMILAKTTSTSENPTNKKIIAAK